MDTFSILPQYKNCYFCNDLLAQSQLLKNTNNFLCEVCNQVTKWNHLTILESSKISITKIEKLLTLFLDNKTASEANNVLKYSFINEGLNIKTVYRYYEIFNLIVHDFVERKMQSIIFDGEVEIDETYLVKEKKTKAPRRAYKNSSQWLFGIRKRGTTDFFIAPIENKDAGTILPLIFRHIKINSKIYSDSYSVYVNNRTIPKNSHLKQYGYIHYFVNHKIEFVSALLETIHTNTIESLWKEIKTYLRKSRNTNKFLFSIYRYYFTKKLTKKMQIEILLQNLQKENFIQF